MVLSSNYNKTNTLLGDIYKIPFSDFILINIKSYLHVLQNILYQKLIYNIMKIPLIVLA